MFVLCKIGLRSCG